MWSEPASRQSDRRHRSDQSSARRFPLNGHCCRSARLAEGSDGTIWASCDIGSAIIGIDPKSGKLVSMIQVETKGGHWIVAGQQGKAYLSNRAGPGIPVVNLASHHAEATIETPHAITGLDLSIDGRRLSVERTAVAQHAIPGEKVGFWRFVRRSKDPLLFESLIKDAAAPSGIGIAGAGILASWLLGLL